MRLLRLVHFLLLAALLAPGSVWAEDYALELNGVQVSSENCGDLAAAIEGVEGTVSYDPNSTTLTLRDARVSAAVSGIRAQIEGLTIRLEGENTVEGAGLGISLLAETTITGPGRLSVEHTGGSSAIFATGQLTIEGCTLVARSNEWGITGRDKGKRVDNKPLIIRNANVRATGRKEGSIFAFGRIVLDGCFIAAPSGARLGEGEHDVVNADGEVLKEEVVIRRLEDYDLWLNGVRVSSTTSGDLAAAIEGVEGTVSYDADSATLTLRGATIEASRGAGIRSGIEGLTIRLEGENAVGGDEVGMHFSAPTTIAGPGSIDVKSGGPHAIRVVRTSLTVDGCSLAARAEKRGISGDAGDVEQLTVRNATVRAAGLSEGSIAGFRAIGFVGCGVVAPVGAGFDEGRRAVVDADGEVLRGEVVIAPPAVRRLRLSPARLELGVGEEVELEVSYEPEVDASRLRWDVPEGYGQIVAIVPGSPARIRGLEAGETRVRVRVENWDGVAEAVCDVRVRAEPGDDTPVVGQSVAGLSLSPNPVSGVLRIGGLSSRARATVHNALGLKVLEGYTEGALDVSGLAEGVYLLRVEGQTLRFTKP